MSRNQIEIKQVTLGGKEDLPVISSLDDAHHTVFLYAIQATLPVFL
jgi:hypothetical protein